MFYNWCKCFSLFMNLIPSFLLSYIPFTYPYTTFINYPFSCLDYYIYEYFLTPSSISYMNILDPMISYKYYSSPGLSLSPDLGFICDICSTSPWSIKNLLLFRSIPSLFNLFLTSSWVDSLLLISYFDTLWLFTVLLRLNDSLVISLYSPFSDSCIFLKYTSTDVLVIFISWEIAELWISWFSLCSLIQLALYPNMNNMLSIKLDLPEPLGPTMLVKFLWMGPISWRPAYDLKFSNTIFDIISLYWPFSAFCFGETRDPFCSSSPNCS